MESLATLILVMFIILLLSGPINIGLTSPRIQELASRRKGFTAARRLLMLAIGIVGIFIAINFMYETTPLGPKLFSLIAISGNVYALRREMNFAKSQ